MTVRDIARQVNSGGRSAEQVAVDTLALADAYDEIQPQAWITRVPAEQVLARARLIDQRVAAGDSLALAGVPVAVKDNIDVAGLETTAACPGFAYRPESSAYVIDRLLAAGAVVIGKTNLDQFATGLVGTRSPYGSPGCVFNREYISGGSSSGSAVVVAAGVVPLALGSDTAGSGRIPAGFNNLVGFKATRGRWSARGMLPACRSLDCVTALTCDVEDAVLVDSVVAGFDRLDPYARRTPPTHPGIPRAFRFGVPRPSQLKDLGPQEMRLFNEALPRLKAAGGTAIAVDVAPLLEAARLLYGGPWVAERTAVLETLLNTNPAAIHPVVRAIVQAGKGVTGVDTFRGFYALQQYARVAEELWDSVDVLVLPTAPAIYRKTEVLAEPVALNAHIGLYTNFVNLLDMTAISLPAGFRDNNTGFGVTLIAPAWSDLSLLDLAGRYLRAAPLPPAPELDRAPRPSHIKLAVVGGARTCLECRFTGSSPRAVRAWRGPHARRLHTDSTQWPARTRRSRRWPIPEVGGGSIELEVYELDTAAFGSFVAEVPPPLAIGTVILEDGTTVKGFVAEPRALVGARDITAFGGWRAYLAAR
ncbi:MAG: allophanate hydrolase [Steroidobacteraceae bacterium]